MPCTFNLRTTMLSGSAAGGTWTKIGYNATTPNGTFGAGGSSLPLGGDDPLINPADIIAGYYLLSYSDGCNAPQNVIYWSQDSVTAGTPNALTYCVNDGIVVNLFDALTGEDTGGVWSISPNSDPFPNNAFNQNNGTLDLGQLGGNYGEFKFNYVVTAQVNSDFESLFCEFCQSIQEVTINILPSFQAGNDTTTVISLSNGSFNLFDKITGSKDTDGIWTQLSGSSVPIGGSYLGTVNLDAISGCSFSFKYSGGAGNCYDESIAIINKNANWNLSIATSGNTLTANHNSCGYGSMTYQWFKNTGSGFISMGLTTQSISTTGTATYKVIITCNGCSQEATKHHTQVCNNNPCFAFNYDSVNDQLTLVNNGTNNSPVGSDVLQWKQDGGNYATYTGAISGCNLREFLDVTPFCTIFSGMIRVGYSSFTACAGRTISQVFVEYGDGTTETHSGSLSSDYVQWTPSQWQTKGNSATFRIRTSTPLGYIFKKIKFTYDGSGTLSCTNMTTTHINYPKLYYKIWGKRTVQYTDGCPTIVCESFYQKDNGCILDVVLNNCTTSGGASAVCANVFNCGGTATYQWKRNGTVLTGETNSYCPISYGNGTYEVIVTCNGCVATDTIVVQPPCSMEVYITQSGTTLTANVFNCSGTKTYQWYKKVAGVWTIIGSNSPTLTTTGNGDYKVNVTCVATGCVKEAEYTYYQSCSVTVNITVSGNVLTAVPTGCTGAITYTWQKWNGTAWVNVGTNSNTYTVTETATYKVVVDCDGCQAEKQIYHQMPCGVGVTIGVTGSGASQTLTANVTGCGTSPITYLWERWNGTAWVFFASTQTITVTIPSTYRITATCNGCPAIATYDFTGCSVSVTIGVSGNTLAANPSGCTGSITYTWSLSTDGGVTFSYYGSGQVITANQSGIYKVTISCNGCTALAQVTYTNPCNSNVTLNYTAPTLTATITGCPSPQSIVWQYSSNYNPSQGGCSGWTQIATGVTSIVPTQTGCYRCTILCNGSCPNEAMLYIVIANPCDNVTMIVNPQIGKLSFDKLKKNGVIVTNYLISWRNSSNVEIFKSGAGSFFNSNTMYPHPSSNIPMQYGTYKPFILNSDFGSNLDCLPNFSVPAIVCGTTYNNSYNGAGGIAASQTMSVNVNASTGYIKIGFRTYTVADKVQVKYNGSIIFDSGNVVTGYDYRLYVVPITYVSGQNYADVIVTNSTPSLTTKWDIKINCCNPKTPCPVNLVLPNVTADLGQFCECNFNTPTTFANFDDLFNNLCLTVDEYKPSPIQTTGGCGAYAVSSDYNCLDCSDIITTKVGTSGISIQFPNSCSTRYFAVKSRIQAITNNKQYCEITLKKVICASDGAKNNLVIFPTYGSVTFNDATFTITYLMAASNPFSNSCTNCDVWLYDLWNTFNAIYSNASSSIFGIHKAIDYDRTMAPAVVNVSELEFEEKIVSECGTKIRKYKISYRNNNCPCQSWELYEDVDLNGSYETLRQQAAGWTGICI